MSKCIAGAERPSVLPSSLRAAHGQHTLSSLMAAHGQHTLSSLRAAHGQHTLHKNTLAFWQTKYLVFPILERTAPDVET